MNKNKILLVSAATELLLVLIWVAWSWYRENVFIGLPSRADLKIGLLFSIPLFVINFIFFGIRTKQIPILDQFLKFRDRVVYPLAKMMDIPTALIVSILAGFGEELFFRGVLLTETGIIISSLLFSVLHFGFQVKIFPLVALLYFLIGCYFAWLCQYTGSLWPAIIAHAFYDFVIIMHLKRILVLSDKFSENDSSPG
jgi:membrane protease YdiL (CAAX protease family)